MGTPTMDLREAARLPEPSSWYLFQHSLVGRVLMIAVKVYGVMLAIMMVLVVVLAVVAVIVAALGATGCIMLGVLLFWAMGD